MALNTGFTELDETTNTFSDWLSKTNTMINLMRDEVMTANSTYANTTGDARLFGTFVANTVVVPDELRGGDSGASANLAITSNVNITGTLSTGACDELLPSADETALGNSSLQWEGYFSNIYVSGALSVGTITTDVIGTMEGILTGDVYNTDGVIVLDSGTNSITASYTGNVTGNVTGNISSTGTSTFSSIDVNGGAIDNTPIGVSNRSSGAFTTLSATGDITSTGTSTFATVDINGGAIDNTTIGVSNPSSGAFTTLSATGGITGDLTGDVTSDAIVTGNISTSSGNLQLNSATQIIEIRGNGTTIEGAIVLNCETNSHGQKIIPQPHSEAVTNILTLPAGGNQELVGTDAIQTLTNKTINGGTFNGDVTANTIAITTHISSTSTLELKPQDSIVEIASNGSADSILSLVTASGSNSTQIKPASTSTIIFTLPNGNNQEIVGTTANQTISNKNITANNLFGTVQSLTGSGAVDLLNVVTEVTTSGGAASLSLADGTNGQIKMITMVSDDGNDATLTPTSPLGYSSIVFNDAGDSVTLMYSSQGWVIAGIYGANTA